MRVELLPRPYSHQCSHDNIGLQLHEAAPADKRVHTAIQYGYDDFRIKRSSQSGQRPTVLSLTFLLLKNFFKILCAATQGA